MSPVSRASILLRHGEISTVSRACILAFSAGYLRKYATVIHRRFSSRFFDGLMTRDDSSMSIILFLPPSLSLSSYFSVFKSGHSWLEISKCFLHVIHVLGVLLRKIVALTSGERAFQTILSFLQFRS